VGWEGEGYDAVKNLVSRLEQSGPLKGRVSTQFVLEEVFTWLCETLETKRTDTLPEFIASRCLAEIKPHVIWIPVYRTYSAREFSMGGVKFRTISRPMLERWYSRIPEEQRKSERGPDVVLNRQRSALQGTLAACINVDAEPTKALEVARAAADEAIALLRFLSEVNWTCRITSHCLPIGRENTRTTMDIVVENGDIRSIGKGAIEQGPRGWNVDEARQTPLTAGVLESLHELASQRAKTELRTDLYGALQLHARHSVTRSRP
jgi:hypothetical protein